MGVSLACYRLSSIAVFYKSICYDERVIDKSELSLTKGNNVL